MSGAWHFRAPATAWGLSRPVDAAFNNLGCGRRLVRLVAAGGLAGRGVEFADVSFILGGCREARLFPTPVREFWLASLGLGKAGCEKGPGDAIRSRKDRRDTELLDGVSSGIGDEEAARPKGLRMGSFEAEDGVLSDAEPGRSWRLLSIRAGGGEGERPEYYDRCRHRLYWWTRSTLVGSPM